MMFRLYVPLPGKYALPYALQTPQSTLRFSELQYNRKYRYCLSITGISNKGLFVSLTKNVLTLSLRLPFGQFTDPLSGYPCIYKKKFKNLCREKSWEVGGFYVFSFCHNNDYVPEILETLSRFGQLLYF